MVIYEITANIEPELCLAYERFMAERHIPDLLATGAFIDATFESSMPGRYKIRYRVSTQETLDQYLTEHAPRLRADFEAAFPNGADISREVWTVLANLP